MSVRIRVYPQTGAFGANGLNGMGAVSASTYYNSKLTAQKQVSSLQLGYERALWNERLEKVRLEERLKNPYAALQTGYAGAFGGMPFAGGIPGIGGLGTLGGFPATLGATLPMMAGGSGQTNVTNQSGTGGSQTVTNNNSFTTANRQVAPGWGGFGGGGLFSGLLGALI